MFQSTPAIVSWQYVKLQSASSWSISNGYSVSNAIEWLNAHVSKWVKGDVPLMINAYFLQKLLWGVNVVSLIVMLCFLLPGYTDQYWLIFICLQLVVNILDRGLLRQHLPEKYSDSNIGGSIRYLILAVGLPLFYPVVSHNRYLWLMVVIGSINVIFTLASDASKQTKYKKSWKNILQSPRTFSKHKSNANSWEAWVCVAFALSFFSAVKVNLNS